MELRDSPIRKDGKAIPLSPLLKKPYAEISQRDWWVGFVWALALRGNFYGLVIERNAQGFAVQVKPIHNDAVHVQRNRVTGALEYRYYGEEVNLRDVVHVRYQTTPGNVIGLNPIQALALTFGNAVAQQRFVESFFLNSANPMGVIEVPGPLDPTETRKMLRGWLAGHQGLNKANLPAVLTENAAFKPITISPKDSMLLEALNFSEEQICGRIFRVPPKMVGIGVERRTDVEQDERAFFSNTLVGYLSIGTEALTALHPPGQYVHFDTTERTRGRTLERAQAAALLMNSGVGLADDLREWFDWAALPGGEGKQSFMPINSQLLDAALLALTQAEAPEPGPEDPFGGGNGNGGGGGGGGSKPPPSTGPAGQRALTEALLRTLAARSRRAPAHNGHGNGHAVAADVEATGQAIAQELRRQTATPVEVNLRPEFTIKPEFRVEQPGVTIYQEAPSPAEINFAPVVNVEQPEVHVAPGHVTVERSDVNVSVPPAEVRVEVPAAEPVIHVESPEVRVDVPPAEVRVDVQPADAQVNVEAPNVEVNPTINVPPAEVRVDVPETVVNVEQPEVNVNVPPAEVHVESPTVEVKPQINVPPARRTSKRIETDDKGNPVRLVEEPADDE